MPACNLSLLNPFGVASGMTRLQIRMSKVQP